ncbi:exosortase/archaeosortase family protein [Novosphingobium resinovorum]|uniref:exosortase/archaeosortase family protein n=1 Tax=Novosphingobium resinovorum TaxID=158500 RepID=UPI002ED5A78D|nr:exosortase/archaeosortase family protein [Novosphingobium resinovorum]
MSADVAAAALVAMGLAALYVPVLATFGAQYFWDEDDNHSSVLLLMTGYAFWADRAAFGWRSTRAEAAAGAALVMAGLAIFFLGRLTDVIQLLGVSLPICVAGLCLGFGGWSLLKRWWLLCGLLVFIVPWLGASVDGLLVPLRLLLTRLATSSIALFGYPVSSTGVIVTVGFVQLSIAGACIGLRSMVSMVAIGVLFLHFLPPRSWLGGVAFLLLVPVIALGANFLRIIFLVLVAGQFGASGEAAVHDFAAYGEILIAMGGFLTAARALGVGEASAGSGT